MRTIRRLESQTHQRPRSHSIRLVAEALNLTDQERAQLAAACGPPEAVGGLRSGAAVQIAALCAGLPLALALTAAAMLPALALTELAGRLERLLAREAREGRESREAREAREASGPAGQEWDEDEQ